MLPATWFEPVSALPTQAQLTVLGKPAAGSAGQPLFSAPPFLAPAGGFGQPAHFGDAGSVAGPSGDSPPPQRSTHQSLIGSWWCRDPCATNAVGDGPEGSAGPWAMVAPRLFSFGGAAVDDAAPHLRAMAIRPRPGLESVGHGVRPEPTMTRTAQQKRPTDAGGRMPPVAREVLPAGCWTTPSSPLRCSSSRGTRSRDGTGSCGWAMFQYQWAPRAPGRAPGRR